MPGSTGQKGAADAGIPARDLPKLAHKIVLLADDSFLESHCGRLLAVLSGIANEVVAIARSPDRIAGTDQLGTSIIIFDCSGSLNNPVRDAGAAWKLARILEAESADALHVIGVRPAALVGLALKLVGANRIVVHLPHLDGLEPATMLSRFYRPSPARLVQSLVHRPSSFLLVEDPDGLVWLRARGVDPGARFAVMGGSGIDPDVYPVLPPSQADMPIMAYAGRMVASSGLDVLMRAFDRAWARGVRLQLELIGEHAPHDPGAISPRDIAQWRLHPGMRRTEAARDMREVWRRADICVLPAVGRLGIPRVLLEAAACGRALIVTPGTGGGTFVRDGVEGLVVPCGDVAALAEAIERLARDGDLRARLGEAARLRVLQGFTEAHVNEQIRSAYLALLGMPRAA